jgi:DNA-directed RNA polymerase II subunit RPB2
MVNMTRQPTEGRSRDGGLKIGEMERDCMVSHGISRFAKDRLYENSDKYNVHSCNKCGAMVSFNLEKGISCCRVCDNRTDFSRLELPFACKLLFQELNVMNISPRLITTGGT